MGLLWGLETGCSAFLRRNTRMHGSRLSPIHERDFSLCRLIGRLSSNYVFFEGSAQQLYSWQVPMPYTGIRLARDYGYLRGVLDIIQSRSSSHSVHDTCVAYFESVPVAIHSIKHIRQTPIL